MARIGFLRRVLIFVLLIGLVSVEAVWPAEPSWPRKEITLICPYSPGGGFDTQARIFAQVWVKHLPQKVNVIVNNRTGASGKIGSIALMKSTPDGYTVGLLAPTLLTLSQALGELEGFDTRKLTWLGQLSLDPGAVVVSAASGLKTIPDLTKREVRIGVTVESLFANALLAKRMNLKWRAVMFDGSAEQSLAAMRGDVDLMMDSWTSMKKAVDNGQGKLTPLFALADTRLSQWSNVPSSKEQGLSLSNLYPIAGSTRSLGAPSGIPADLAKVMEESVWATLRDPEFKATMEKAQYDASFVANGADAAKTVDMIMNVLDENKDVLESLKKK